MNKTDHKRLDSIDAIKGLCIFFMVCGHLTNNSNLYWREFIYLFHMGCFFMVSGFFLRKIDNISITDVKKYIIKKSKRLYLPFLLTSLPISLLLPFLYQIHWINAGYTITQILRSCIFNITFYYPSWLFLQCWFLKSQFFALCMVFLIINYIKKQKIQIALVLALYLLGYFLSKNRIELPWVLNRELCVVSVCYIGYLLNKLKVSKQSFIENIRNKVFLLLIVSFSILLIAANYITIDVWNNTYTIPFDFPLFSVIGFVFCYCLHSLIKPIQWINKLLVYVGKHSLSIFLFHIICFKPISYLYLYVNNIDSFDKLVSNTIEPVSLLWGVAYVVSGIGLPLLFNCLINKISFLIKQ